MAYLRIPFCSPYKLLWPLVVPAKRPSDVIHRAYAGHVWRMHGLKALPVVLFYSIVWPIPFAWLALKHTCKLGGRVKAASGKGRLRQFAEQFRVALCYSISPKKYYVFELFRPEHVLLDLAEEILRVRAVPARALSQRARLHRAL